MSNSARAVLVILIAGLVPRLSILFATQETLVRTLPDDAFYYFQTARHIVAGNGSTFDGLHPTNGYHPLWMLLLLPIAAVAEDPLTLARCALALSILCGLLSTTLLYLLLRRLTTLWWIPPLGAGLYFLNSQAIVSNLNGLETSVSTLFFVITVYLIVRALQERPTLARASLLGLCLGVLFLARTDNVFYIAMFLLIVFMKGYRSERHIPEGDAYSTAQRGTRISTIRALANVGARVGITVAVAAAVVVPWLAWNVLNFGSIVQSSGLAVPYLLQESYRLEGYDDSQMFQLSLVHLVSFLRSGIYIFIAIPAYVFVPAAVLCLAVLGYTLRRRPGQRDQPTSGRSLTGPNLVRDATGAVLSLWLGAAILVFAHAYVRWNPRDWYFDQIIALSALTLCLALVVLNPSETIPKVFYLARNRAMPRISEDTLPLPTLRRTVTWIGRVAAIIMLLTPLALGSVRLWNGIYPHQAELLDAAYWLKANTGRGDIAAGFNSGIVGFFSDRPVVNLDGVINNAAYAAITKKDLTAFMRQSQVRYYVDFDPQMLDLYARFMGEAQSKVTLVPVAAFERPNVDWYNSLVRVYRLDWHD